jgi:hypothetical protein
MWGKCHPEDCDWGEVIPDSFNSKDGTIFLTWEIAF